MLLVSGVLLNINTYVAWAQEENSESIKSDQLTPEQTLNRQRISDLQLSPDGNKIAFVVTEPVSGTKRNSDIWILDIKSNESRKFTTSEKSDRRPRWSPDGKTLAFLSNRSDKNQIYLLPMQGGESTALTKGENSINSFEWSLDGKQIAFFAQVPKTEEDKKKEENKDDARVVDFDDRHSKIWIANIESQEVRQITHGNWRIQEGVWMPGGDQLLVSATDHPQPELETNCIYTVGLEDGKFQKVSSPAQPFGDLAISPDGKTIAYVGSRVDGPIAFDLYLQPVSGGSPRNITQSSIDRLINSVTWNKDSSLQILTQAGFKNVFYTITQEGKAQKIEESNKYVTWAFTSNEDNIFFVGETAIQAPEIIHLKKSGETKQLTHLNKEWDSISLIKPEIIQYISFDGVPIEAALLKPAKYKKGNPYPFIVLVHGGPAGRWADRFDSWGQLLAARGYVVLYPNIRGSTGYGFDFMTKNRKDWGGGDYKDVLAGVDFMVKQGIADPERLGIGGWSYGGYMAAWAVTQTNMFKASVSGAPMTDLASEYGTELSGINAYDTWYMDSPYENPYLFINRSPGGAA